MHKGLNALQIIPAPVPLMESWEFDWVLILLEQYAPTTSSVDSTIRRDEEYLASRVRTLVELAGSMFLLFLPSQLDSNGNRTIVSERVI